MTNGQVTAKRAVVWPALARVAVLAGATATGIGALSLADALMATGRGRDRRGIHPARRLG